MNNELVMNPEQYITTQMRVLEMGKIANSLDLDAFLQCIENAETMAPAIDPTLYMKAIDNMRAVKKLAKIAKEMQTAFAESYETILKTAVSGYMQKPAGKL